MHNTKIKLARLVAAITVPGTKIANTDSLNVEKIPMSLKLGELGLQVEIANKKFIVPHSNITFVVVDEA